VGEKSLGVNFWLPIAFTQSAQQERREAASQNRKSSKKEKSPTAENSIKMLQNTSGKMAGDEKSKIH
jgi:hypothetical protein